MLSPARARLRARTRGYTLTPRAYARVAYVALGALTLIVLTGAAVRLTGSGLGCPHWPACYGHAYPPLNSHAVIEYSNRLITGPVSIAALAAFLLAFRRRPYRRDLARLAALLPLGVLAQAILGGLTVEGKLAYGWVMGHFALSIALIAAAWALVWRASREPIAREHAADEQGAAREGTVVRAGTIPAAGRAPGVAVSGAAGAARDRVLLWCSRALVALGALTIFAGTAATAAGPHAGGEPGQRISRLSFDGKGTMDFVIHRHAEVAIAFGLLALAVWFLARTRGAGAQVRRATTFTCVLLALQGVVGAVQYETHLPTELVWVHVCLASLLWITTLWVASTLATPAARPVDEPSEGVAKGPQAAHDGAFSAPPVLASR
jgi:cytochrome c oxidase assembly protein subunit 15